MPARILQNIIVFTVFGGLILSCTKSDLVPIPSISSFSPQVGPVSTQVIITGVNFSGQNDQNEVRFNGVKASVTASSGTQITATVPTNATSGVISVTVNGQSCLSSSHFTINPLMGTWRFASATATNCPDPSDDGITVCTLDCPTLTVTAGAIVYADGPTTFNFTYSLSATTLTITSPGGSFSATYVLTDNQLTLVYPPGNCSVTETYVKL